MSARALRKCSSIGCRTLTRNGDGRCDLHARKGWGRTPQSAASQKLYDARWQQASKRYLNANPLCVECGKEGRTGAASCTDHVVPHRGDLTLFWDENNWQPLCDAHHRSKTAKGQ